MRYFFTKRLRNHESHSIIVMLEAEHTKFFHRIWKEAVGPSILSNDMSRQNDILSIVGYMQFFENVRL